MCAWFISICVICSDFSIKTKEVSLRLTAVIHEGYLLADQFKSLSLHLQNRIFQEWVNYSFVLHVGNKPFEMPLQEHCLCAWISMCLRLN